MSYLDSIRNKFAPAVPTVQPTAQPTVPAAPTPYNPAPDAETILSTWATTMQEIKNGTRKGMQGTGVSKVYQEAKSRLQAANEWTEVQGAIDALKAEYGHSQATTTAPPTQPSLAAPVAQAQPVPETHPQTVTAEIVTVNGQSYIRQGDTFVPIAATSSPSGLWAVTGSPYGLSVQNICDIASDVVHGLKSDDATLLDRAYVSCKDELERGRKTKPVLMLVAILANLTGDQRFTSLLETSVASAKAYLESKNKG